MAIMLACANADLKYNPVTNDCVKTEDIEETTEAVDPNALAFFVGIGLLFLIVTPIIIKKLKEPRN